MGKNRQMRIEKCYLWEGGKEKRNKRRSDARARRVKRVEEKRNFRVVAMSSSRYFARYRVTTWLAEKLTKTPVQRSANDGFNVNSSRSAVHVIFHLDKILCNTCLYSFSLNPRIHSLICLSNGSPTFIKRPNFDMEGGIYIIYSLLLLISQMGSHRKWRIENFAFLPDAYNRSC